MLSPDLLTAVERQLSTKISQIHSISGGNSHVAFRLEDSAGISFFLKQAENVENAYDMLRSEQLGLALLGASRVMAVPKVLALGQVENSSDAFLVLEWVEQGTQNRLFWERFGTSLGNLHGNTSEWFGFSHDNYIGRLPQSNRRHDTWEDFYTHERLLPQMKWALEKELATAEDMKMLEKVCKKVAQICPEEAPSLIHGDLWQGNFLCSRWSEPVLIDPAAAFSHREMDLAMSLLFGGFPAIFYESYRENYPLEPHFEQRAEVYQLYYLLVHVNLFGVSYLPAVRQILKRFA